MLKMHVPVDIREELSPNVRMILARDPGDIIMIIKRDPSCMFFYSEH
jgi:hypothetical protein